MRRFSPRSAPFVAACALFVASVVVVSGCKKKGRPPIEIEAGPALPEAAADLDAKETVALLVSAYPVACDAAAASKDWMACRETGGGYGKVYGCAEKGLRDARNALSALRPSTPHRAACAEQIDKASVAMVNAMPTFFADVVAWLQVTHDALAPLLAQMPLGEACRESRDLCAKEPHEYGDRYKAMRMHGVDTIECTTKLFRCGLNDAMDCSLGNVVPRLGIACAGTPNRTGATPDDLLYVRDTGTPLAR